MCDYYDAFYECTYIYTGTTSTVYITINYKTILYSIKFIVLSNVYLYVNLKQYTLQEGSLLNKGK